MTAVVLAAAAPPAESLNERIGDFGGLVGIVLVLATLFTQQRNEKRRQLIAGRPTEGDWAVEIFLNVVLAVATIGLFAAGLPLVIDGVKGLDPLADTGPLRGAFAIVWVLLIALIAWQIVLAVGACKKRKSLRETNRAGGFNEQRGGEAVTPSPQTGSDPQRR
jgi:hypothetical protein